MSGNDKYGMEFEYGQIKIKLNSEPIEKKDAAEIAKYAVLGLIIVAGIYTIKH